MINAIRIFTIMLLISFVLVSCEKEEGTVPKESITNVAIHELKLVNYDQVEKSSEILYFKEISGKKYREYNTQTTMEMTYFDENVEKLWTTNYHWLIVNENGSEESFILEYYIEDEANKQVSFLADGGFTGQVRIYSAIDGSMVDILYFENNRLKNSAFSSSFTFGHIEIRDAENCIGNISPLDIAGLKTAPDGYVWMKTTRVLLFDRATAKGSVENPYVHIDWEVVNVGTITSYELFDCSTITGGDDRYKIEYTTKIGGTGCKSCSTVMIMKNPCDDDMNIVETIREIIKDSKAVDTDGDLTNDEIFNAIEESAAAALGDLAANTTFPCGNTNMNDIINKAKDNLRAAGIPCNADGGNALVEEVEELSESMGGIDLSNSELFTRLDSVKCTGWKPPCWNKVLGEHLSQSQDFSSWCSKYAGKTLSDLNAGGWYSDSNSPIFVDNDWRYITDPTNSNYVIDMRHLLFVGFYGETTTGLGIGLGDIYEITQLFTGHEKSALNWQDFFSNRLGAAFAKYLDSININFDKNTTKISDLLCEFLDSPTSLYQRPFPNPDNCN